MKITKSCMVATLVAGSFWAGGVTLPAQNVTNPPTANLRPAGTRGFKGGPIVDRLAAALKLDDATKAKVKTIIEAQQQKVRDLLADAALSQAERRTRMQAIREDTAKQMKAALTPEQFDRWQQMSQPRVGREAPAATPQK